VLSIVGVLGPVFIDGKVTSDVCLGLLSDELGSFLLGYDIPTNSAWLQQDGARPRTNSAVLRCVQEVFEKQILPNRYHFHYLRKIRLGSWGPGCRNFANELTFKDV
jgi:hypothetical protein